MTSTEVDWKPFIESLHEAADLWDTGLAWRGRRPEFAEDDDDEPPRVVPITPDDAESLMRAVAFLARRLSVAAECVVYVTAESRLGSTEEDADGQADALSLTALHAAAMRHAADLASAASGRSWQPSVGISTIG